jgi:Zn-dependent peptidase ImmA (M78 family)/transcriptional regulator with XRE-family HTH domain
MKPMENQQLLLANKLKNARKNAKLTQDHVAQSLSLQRTAIVQMEAGKRSVSTLELSKLAQLYGCPVSSFFSDSDPSREEDALVALFRATQTEGGSAPWQTEVARCLEICRAGVELDRVLSRPPHAGPPSYQLPQPQNTMEAVEQGERVAEQERRRLSLGHNPIPDMAELINGQNIWASCAMLPDEMSGLFLHHSSIGLFILVNYSHPRARKRFSYAHEYAHALLDREHKATVSLVTDRKKLSEVRANAFAASLLLPRTGVCAFLASRFKASPSVSDQEVYDPMAEEDRGEVKASRRAVAISQTLTFEDVAALAYHFSVSYQAALFRLKSLAIVNATEFEDLRGKESLGIRFLEMLELWEDLYGTETRSPDRELTSQVVHLALEAFRREEISTGKMRELSKLLGVPAKDLLQLAEAT